MIEPKSKTVGYFSMKSTCISKKNINLVQDMYLEVKKNVKTNGQATENFSITSTFIAAWP